jgi:hypothetical protein
MPTLKVTKQKLPDYIYIASFINFDDLFCIPYLGICVFFDWCTIFVQKFIGQALWKEKEQLNHEFNTKLPTPTLVNISFKISLQIVILFPRWLLLSFSTNCYFLPFSYNGHTWPTGQAGLARAFGDGARHGTKMKWVVLYWLAGPEAKLEHGPVTFKRVMSGRRPNGLVVPGRPDARIYTLCLFFL